MNLFGDVLDVNSATASALGPACQLIEIADDQPVTLDAHQAVVDQLAE